MKIEHAYLIWVGSEHYEDIKSYSEEAVALGISKRLPSAYVGRELMKPNTVVFLAHDEGATRDCSKCVGPIECPDCRKLEQMANSLGEEVERQRARFEDFAKEAPQGAKRFVDIRERKVLDLHAKMASCKLCKNEGTYMAGTGGTVVLKGGKTIDYRTYNYWLHQPKKFDPRTVKSTKMCKACGGKGELPQGRVFGMFIPESVEYILTGEETEKAMDLVKDFVKVDKATLVAEPRRRCGYRKPGGVYVVTSKEADPKLARKAIRDLVDRGVVKADGAEATGNYVRFTRPVPINRKRFRGIGAMSVEELGAVSEQAEMATDALEGAA